MPGGDSKFKIQSFMCRTDRTDAHILDQWSSAQLDEKKPSLRKDYHRITQITRIISRKKLSFNSLNSPAP